VSRRCRDGAQNTRVYPLIQKLSTIVVYNCAKIAA
jgi:hypothetical protein